MQRHRKLSKNTSVLCFICTEGIVFSSLSGVAYIQYVSGADTAIRLNVIYGIEGVHQYTLYEGRALLKTLCLCERGLI